MKKKLLLPLFILAIFSCAIDGNKKIDEEKLSEISRSINDGEFITLNVSELDDGVIVQLNQERLELGFEELKPTDSITIVSQGIIDEDADYLEKLSNGENPTIPTNKYFVYEFPISDSRDFRTYTHLHVGQQKVTHSHITGCNGSGWTSLGTSLSGISLVYNGLYSYTKRTETKAWKCSNSSCSARLERKTEVHYPGGSAYD